MKRKLAIALALSLVPVLVGCGSSSSSNGNPVPGPGASYNSGYPTLVIGAVPAGMPAAPGSNQSFAAQTYGSITTNGCIPLGQPISFNGSGAYVAGISTYGQTFYSNGSKYASPYGDYSPGDIAVTISNGTVSGTLQLSQYEISKIQQYTGATCISGIALVGNLDTTPQYPGFEGYAALYINNTAHGFITDQFFGAN